MTQLSIDFRPLFDIGELYSTVTVQGLLLPIELMRLVNRHRSGDYGNLSKEDKELNDEALATGGRIFSSYKTPKGKFYVITEADRSHTTVLLPTEY